jgi:hypothetical protein
MDMRTNVHWSHNEEWRVQSLEGKQQCCVCGNAVDIRLVITAGRTS